MGSPQELNFKEVTDSREVPAVNFFRGVYDFKFDVGLKCLM